MTKKKNRELRGIGGWLIVILLLCILSWISNFVLLVQKITSITIQTPKGVFISASLLLIYLFFIGFTIFMILTKKKLAIKLFIISMVIGAIFLIWYYLISLLIYSTNISNQIFSNLLTIIINIAITALIALYFIKSKRVKNTLIK
jgi:hypothetical protein